MRQNQSISFVDSGETGPWSRKKKKVFSNLQHYRVSFQLNDAPREVYDAATCIEAPTGTERYWWPLTTQNSSLLYPWGRYLDGRGEGFSDVRLVVDAEKSEDMFHG